MSKLPTMEEFKAQNSKNYIEFDDKKVGALPVCECPKCGGNVYRDISIVYMTVPPKYKYFCRDCGAINIF